MTIQGKITEKIPEWIEYTIPIKIETLEKQLQENLND